MEKYFFIKQDLIDRAMNADRDRSQDEVEVKLATLEKTLKYFELTVAHIYFSKDEDEA